MHQRALPHVSHLVRQHVNHLGRQRANQAEHPRVNHLLYASKTHHRIHVSPLEFLRRHVSQPIIPSDPNPVQTEHPVTVVVLVEVPEEVVVLVGVVPEEAVVEDANNRFLYLEFHSNGNTILSA